MSKIFNNIFNVNPRYSTTISFILGLILIDDLTAPEQNMLGNWIILLGQTILTNASNQNVIESRIAGGIININSKEIKAIYEPFIYDIKKIRNIIDSMYPDNYSDIEILHKTIKEIEQKIEELKKD